MLAVTCQLSPIENYRTVGELYDELKPHATRGRFEFVEVPLERSKKKTPQAPWILFPHASELLLKLLATFERSDAVSLSFCAKEWLLKNFNSDRQDERKYHRKMINEIGLIHAPVALQLTLNDGRGVYRFALGRCGTHEELIARWTRGN